MPSMYSKLRQATFEAPTKKPTFIEVLGNNSGIDKYYICTENGKMIACGMSDDILKQLPEDYHSKEVKYMCYDPIMASIKVAF